MIIYDGLVQGSEEWFAARCGKPTGSMFSKLVTSKGVLSKSIAEYAITLAADMFAGKALEEWQGNQWTDRGTELEPEARGLYEFKNDCKVEEVGFVTDDDGLWGVSPDGLVGDDGLVEFKCLKPENHVKAILRHEKDGSIDPTYIQQVQGQMLVCGRKWCDLVFYHPSLPLLVIRQEPSKAVQDGLREAKIAIIKERDKILETLRGL